LLLGGGLVAKSDEVHALVERVRKRLADDCA
jgi:hypothetical protein